MTDQLQITGLFFTLLISPGLLTAVIHPTERGFPFGLTALWAVGVCLMAGPLFLG